MSEWNAVTKDYSHYVTMIRANRNCIESKNSLIRTLRSHVNDARKDRSELSKTKPVGAARAQKIKDLAALDKKIKDYYADIAQCEKERDQDAKDLKNNKVLLKKAQKAFIAEQKRKKAKKAPEKVQRKDIIKNKRQF